MFWSLFFISLGVLLLIQQMFHVDLPLIRIFFGLFLVYLGAKVIFGSFGVQMSGFKIDKISTSTEHVFSNGDFKLHENNKTNREFSTVFGKSILDLTDMADVNLINDEGIVVANVFGRTKIKTNAEIGLKIKSNVAFGSIKVRGQKMSSFGEMDFKSPNYESSIKKLNLKIDSVFGEVEIE